MIRVNPCYDQVNKQDCPNRSINCHSSCLQWALYEKERNAEYERRRLELMYTAGSDNIFKKKIKYKLKRK